MENDFSVWEALVPFLLALAPAAFSYYMAVRKARSEIELLKLDQKLAFSAETLVLQLLEDKRWDMRFFDLISRHVGGFEEDELRKLLVRAGVVRFESKSGLEIWGLLSRNRDKLGLAGGIPDPKNVDDGNDEK